MVCVPSARSPMEQAYGDENQNPTSSGIGDIIFTNDGVWFPNTNWARYRISEYPEGEQFFQWWYFVVLDTQTDTYWAYCYYINKQPNNPELEAFYMIFSMVSPQGNFLMYYKYPLSTIEFLGNDFEFNFAGGKDTITPISNNVFRTSGCMDNPTQVWFLDQTAGMTGISPDTNISWDFTLNRIAGCMFENDLDILSAYEQEITWNTYSFDSTVNGNVSIGNLTWNIDGNPNRYRAYADTDWGQNLIASGEPAIKYNWGFFYASKRDLTDPSRDISIVAGDALSSEAFGLTIDTSGCYAAAYNVLGRNICWKSIHTYPLGIDTVLVEKCSWGSSDDCFVDAHVTRGNWFTYHDVHGDAQVPGLQSLTLEGEYVKIVADFTTTSANINRLLAPYAGTIMSNFEAIGADCHVRIWQKTYQWYDILHLCPQFTLVEDFVDSDAGLEYAYFLPVTI